MFCGLKGEEFHEVIDSRGGDGVVGVVVVVPVYFVA